MHSPLKMPIIKKLTFSGRIGHIKIIEQHPYTERYSVQRRKNPLKMQKKWIGLLLVERGVLAIDIEKQEKALFVFIRACQVSLCQWIPQTHLEINNEITLFCFVHIRWDSRHLPKIKLEWKEKRNLSGVCLLRKSASKNGGAGEKEEQNHW